MLIKEIIAAIEQVAPLQLQETYDNSGLSVGNDQNEISNILVTLDVSERTIDEAIAKHCNLIVSHHPVIFRSLKSITEKNATERILTAAIRHDIAIYSAHTNLDNAYNGINYHLAKKIGLENIRPLEPKTEMLHKLVTFCPVAYASDIQKVLFANGAGQIAQYDQCSFSTEGIGSFRAGENTRPFVGKQGEQHRETEIRIEVTVPAFRERELLFALQKVHPYEEPVVDIYPLLVPHPQSGAGVIGTLDKEENSTVFLQRIKHLFHLPLLRHSSHNVSTVKTVALCGGSGGFLLTNAIREKADIYLTSDLKYHDFMPGNPNIIIADIGHFESEKGAMELLYDIISQKLCTFAVYLSEASENPIKYI